MEYLPCHQQLVPENWWLKDEMFFGEGVSQGWCWFLISVSLPSRAEGIIEMDNQRKMMFQSCIFDIQNVEFEGVYSPGQLELVGFLLDVYTLVN